MIDILIKIFSSKRRNKILNKIKYYYLRIIIAKLLTQYILPTYLKIFPIKKNKNIQKGLIVSLTSFPARIHNLWIVIESILNQTLQPEKIILWLSSLEFKDKTQLPKMLLKLQTKGLEIRFVEENIMSHKKYFYAIKEFPQSYIVTIDDDILYHSSLIENLFRLSMQQNAVVCNYARYINDTNGKINNYTKWPVIKSEHDEPIYAPNIFFGSGGGTIFPPNSLHPDVLKRSLFLELTPRADDIWLNAMCRINNSKIIYLNSKYSLLPIESSNSSKLSTENIGNNLNDVQIKNICDYYGSNIFLK